MSAFFSNLKTSILKNLEPESPDAPSEKVEIKVADDDKDPASSECQNATKENSAASTVAAREKAAQFANRMFGIAAKASHKLQEKAVANLSPMAVIGSIEKERQKFMVELQKEKNSSAVGDLERLLSNPQAQKHIISISAKTENFTEEPPMKFDLDSEVEEIKASANQIFGLDPRLKEVRFALVPKQISEEKFWRNYAYKLSLVKKVLDEKPSPAAEASSTKATSAAGQAELQSHQPSDGKDGADEQLEKELLNDWDEFELVNGAKKGEGSEDGKLATTVEDEDLDKEIDALLEEGGK